MWKMIQPSNRLGAVQKHVIVFALIFCFVRVTALTSSPSPSSSPQVASDYNCVVSCLSAFNDTMTTVPNPSLEATAYACVVKNCNNSTIAGNLYQAEYMIDVFYQTGSIYGDSPSSTTTSTPSSSSSSKSSTSSSSGLATASSSAPSPSISNYKTNTTSFGVHGHQPYGSISGLLVVVVTACLSLFGSIKVI